MADTTRDIYARLQANLHHAEFYRRAGQTPPAGLLLEIEHDEALLASPQHADEAQRLDDAAAMHDARMTPRDENWPAWLAGAAVLLIGAAALRWGPWW